MNFDIIIIGSGPGGYVAAIRASQLGFKTAIIEKESLGGICLNWGCIPTKALLKSAQVFEYIKHADEFGIKVESPEADFTNVIQRSRSVASNMSKGIDFLMKKNKISILYGKAKLKGENSVEVTDENNESIIYSSKNIIIATGARSRELPNIKHDGEKIIGYRQAMNLKKQPKSLIIIGSGAIGVEFAYFYNAMGTNVTIVEHQSNIVPNEDNDVSKELLKNFKKKGIKVLTNASVEKLTKKSNEVIASIKTQNGLETFSCIGFLFLLLCI